MTGRALWGARVRGVDDRLVYRIEVARDWRKDHVGAVVEHGRAPSPGRAAGGARRAGRTGGPDALRARRCDHPGDAGTRGRQGAAPSGTVRGEGSGGRGWPCRTAVSSSPATRCAGSSTRGGDRRRRASFATAIHQLLESPDWLELSDHALTLPGAVAEMGALQQLSRWGAHVVAVAVPT